MKEYQKIESIYVFDSKLKKFKKQFFNPIVEYLQNCKWIGTEKIDGTNVRILWDGYSFKFGARTNEGNFPIELDKLLINTFNSDMEVLFEQKFGNKEVYLFMEGYAGKIQNGTYVGEEKLIGFDIMINEIYLDKFISKEIFESLGLEFVPILEFENLEECINYVHINLNSIIQPESKIEGLVCFPKARIYDHMGKRVMIKIKKRDLLKLEI